MTNLPTVDELSTHEGITSLELVKQVNLFREQEGGRSELKHSDFLKVIRDEFEDEIREGNMSESVEIRKLNQGGSAKYPYFVLNLAQSKQVLVRESKFVRKAVIAYIDKLEKAIKEQFKVPTTFREALLLAAEQQEVIEKQQLQLTEQAPKVEFYNQVVDSKDAIDMGAVAKTINMGIGRNTLFEILRKENVLMRNNLPYQSYIDLGWFRTVESTYTKPSGDTCINIKTVVFQKGMNGIINVLKKKGY